MFLRNPDNWPPIEHIFFEDGLAFNRHTPALYRLRLKTGEISNNFGEELGFPVLPVNWMVERPCCSKCL